MTITEGALGFDLTGHPRGATRKAWGQAILELARADERVVALAADCSRGILDGFIEEFPERFFNVGIAEANLVGVAAGLASCGLVPYATSYAPFLSMRALEQIRDDLAYTNFDAKLGAMLGGVSQGPGGTTHHCTEDLTILRSVANLTVIVPADAVESRQATLAAAGCPGPVYIRLGRDPEPLVYGVVAQEGEFRIGRAATLRDGDDITLIGAGTTVLYALWAADTLRAEGVRARVLNMATVKPLDRGAVVAAARETWAIVTAEENNVLGGLGGAVAEVVVSECPVPMRILGIPDCYAGIGPQAALQARFGITQGGIAAAARELLGRG